MSIRSAGLRDVGQKETDNTLCHAVGGFPDSLQNRIDTFALELTQCFVTFVQNVLDRVHKFSKTANRCRIFRAVRRPYNCTLHIFPLD